MVRKDYFGDAEEPSGVAMDVDGDDVDSLDFFSEGQLPGDLHRLTDSDFFNSFQDDFDDEDID